MPFEKNELNTIPKKLGITANALKTLLSQANNNIENIYNLYHKLGVEYLFIFWPALENQIGNNSLEDEKLLINLFEENSLMFVREQNTYIKDELLSMYQYLDKRYPDNWGMIVNNIGEYITLRSFLGKEDLYNLGGDNIYVG